MNKRQFCNCISFLLLGFITSCGGGGGGSSYSGPAPAPNSAPYFIGLPTEISVVENQTDLITAAAQDDDGDSLTFSLSGTDKDEFNITTLGVITFVSAPNYSTKSSYFFTINVTDGEYTASGSLTVNIFVKENCDSNSIVQPTNGYDLIWSDNFNDSELNNDNWSKVIGNGQAQGIGGWGNNEQQYYSNSANNLYIEEGCLKITALVEDAQDDYGQYSYTSAKIDSYQKIDFENDGRITVKFRNPIGQGLWPAIWMMPSENVFGGWPFSGEIDLMEYRGQNPQEVLSTVHYHNNGHIYKGATYYESQETNFNEVFHEIRFEWTESSMKFILDNNNTIFQISRSEFAEGVNYPFNEKFYLIINMAVGGNFVGSPSPSEMCDCCNPNLCDDKKRLLVDWIKYEKLSSN